MSTAPQTDHFVVVGLGGLGCPAVLGLVAGGATSLTLVDGDRVDASNLHRQVLYGLGDVGCDKTRAAARRLDGLRRGLCLALEPRELDAASVPDLLARASARGPTVVLECSDRPELKFLLHDACLRARIPIVIGAVVGTSGQALAVAPEAGACYRCFYEDLPPAELAGSCAATGVLGTAAGTVGAFMAELALGLRRGTTVPGRLFAFDFRRTTVRELGTTVRPDCTAPHHAVPMRPTRTTNHGHRPDPHPFA